MAENENPAKDFNRIINDLYSLNYTILRVLNTEKGLSSGVYSMSDISASQTPYKRWASDKVLVYSRLRDEYILNFKPVFDLPMYIDVLKQNRTYIINEFNRLYGESMSFSQSIFDCFQNTKFADDSNSLADSTFDSLNLQTVLFLNSFNAYLPQESWFTSIYSAMEIFNALTEELSSSGYKTINFKYPSSQDVKFINKELIVKLDKFSKLKLDETDKKLNDSQKAYNKESRRRFYPTDEMMDQLFQLENLKLLKDLSETLREKVLFLTQRYEAANADYSSFSIKVRDLILNYLSGDGFKIYGRDYKQNSIYIHSFEINEILALLEMFNAPQELFDEMQSILNSKQPERE